MVIAEWFHFYQCNQKLGKSITIYLASLCKQARTCALCAFLSEALHDRLVCGMLHKSIQKILLTKAEVDLDQALEI